MRSELLFLGCLRRRDRVAHDVSEKNVPTNAEYFKHTTHHPNKNFNALVPFVKQIQKPYYLFHMLL